MISGSNAITSFTTALGLCLIGVLLCAVLPSVVLLCDRFGISRQEQDEFALRSHQNAAKAHADGIYDDEVCTGSLLLMILTLLLLLTMVSSSS